MRQGSISLSWIGKSVGIIQLKLDGEDEEERKRRDDVHGGWERKG